MFWYLSSRIASESERALNCFRISSLFGVILAIGVVLIGLNVFLFEVCIFLALDAGIAMHVSSFVVSCPINAISAMSDVAYFAAHIRFSAASVDARSIERWENVSEIGFPMFCKKKERAAAV